MKDSKTIVYQARNGSIQLREDSRAETVCASQKDIASIFGVKSPAITKHLSNIYAEGELSEKRTCSILEQVQKEGSRLVKRKIQFYKILRGQIYFQRY
jgi:hypothetical protein